LQGNWLTFTNCDCAAPIVGGDIEGIVTDRIRDRRDHPQQVWFAERAIGKRVIQLRSSEVSKAVADVVDVNRDGIIDHEDVRLFEDTYSLPTGLSDQIRTSVNEYKAQRVRLGLDPNRMSDSSLRP
jgi:hypothetical protein